MVAQKIKEILERDYLPIIHEMCDEVEVENRSFIVPLSKKRFIKVYEQSFHCYDKETTESLRWWKGAVTIERRLEIRDGSVVREVGDFHVHGIASHLIIHSWDETVEEKVRQRLNFFVSLLLAEMTARRLGLPTKKNEIYLWDGRKAKVKFSPKGTYLLLDIKPKRVFLGNLGTAELLETLARILSLLTL
jgi:hypothetical protein